MKGVLSTEPTPEPVEGTRHPHLSPPPVSVPVEPHTPLRDLTPARVQAAPRPRLSGQEKDLEPKWLKDAKDARLDHTRHPLRGVTVNLTQPPETWNREMVWGLQQPRERAWITPSDVKGLVAREAWTKLRYHIQAEDRDLADLRYYRMRAGWRLVRRQLRLAGHLSRGGNVAEVDLERVLEALPPAVPAGVDPASYNPLADEPLNDFVERVSGLASRQMMYAGTKEDALLGTYQMKGLDNPYFARAAWPTIVELYITELAMAEELVTASHEKTALGFRSYLASEIGALVPEELDDLTAFKDQQLIDHYDVDEDVVRARVLGKIDDLRHQAKEEYSIPGQATAIKMEMVAHGIGRQVDGTSLADLFNTMNKSVMDIRGGEVTVDIEDEDPLEIDK